VHWQSLSIEVFTFIIEDEHRIELIRPDLIETDSEAQRQRCAKIEAAADQQSRLRSLGRVQIVQGTVVTTASVFGRIWAEARVAQLVAPQCPMSQETDGWGLRPLPVYEFGSPVS
jgi:hypothetical protein